MLITAVPVTLVLTMSWFGLYTFVNAYYTRGLGKSNAEWTVLTLWFNGSMILWPFACVPLVARVGHRRLVAVALAAGALLYLAIAFAQTTVALSVIAILMAFVPSVLPVAWIPMVIEAGGDRPGRALAVYALVYTTVGALALVAGGRVLGWAGYQATFLFVAAACAVCAAAFWWASARLPSQPPLEKMALMAIPKRDLIELARGPLAFLMLAGVCMEPFNFHAANQLFPNLARDLHGLPETSISTIVALGRLSALISLLALVRIVDDGSVTAFYGVGLMLAGVCVVALELVHGTALLVVFYCGYYLFHGIVWGTNTAAVNAAVKPRQREFALAIMWSCSTGATFVVGVVHNRLLTAGLSLPAVMRLSGSIGAMAGAVMIGYSFTRFADWSRRAKPTAVKPSE